MMLKHRTVAIVLALTAFSPCPVWADVKGGVDAWAQGDYGRAVAIWKPLADAGDADALFNLGQAYKLGRGVPTDINRALDLYRKATEKGHAQAEDNYGLLLFQQGRRAEAMPYLMRSAERGEPRAQYLAGTALFNGDHVTKDWVRAYAMMSRSAASGLPQAAHTLSIMDQYIPQEQRIEGIALAEQMDVKAQQATLAANTGKPAAKMPAPTQPPRPTATPKPVAAPQKAAPPPPSPAPAPAAQGNWRIQLGAFSEARRAETQWKAVSAKVPALSSYQHYTPSDGKIVRLQAGPLASRADAAKLCVSIKAAGADCIVKAI
ncbi:MAG: SPOR domain-containing protein [Sphingobium sp.]|nr:SPOR domain-containing protein [Sphingobium sp.]MCP5399396.1 SPOR domain-containing protein [Sphingomonas sp.]